MAVLTFCVMDFLAWQTFIDRGGGISRREAEPFFYVSVVAFIIFAIVSAVSSNKPASAPARQSPGMQAPVQRKPKKPLFGGLMAGWILMFLFSLGAAGGTCYFIDRLDFYEWKVDYSKELIDAYKRELKSGSYNAEYTRDSIRREKRDIEDTEDDIDEAETMIMVSGIGTAVLFFAAVGLLAVWIRKRKAAVPV